MRIVVGVRRFEETGELPKSLRERTKQMEQKTEVEQRLQRLPSSTEITAGLNSSTEDIENINRDSLYSNILSIEQKPINDINEH